MNNISREVLAKHFEKLNVSNENLRGTEIDPDNMIQNESLNITIREEEVSKCIRKLKNNKACAHGAILNEFLKNSSSTLVPSITTFCNVMTFKNGGMSL